MKDNYSRWNICIAFMVVAALMLTAACNYIVDPYGYFTYQSGEYEDAVAKHRQDTTFVQREYKLQHVMKHGDQYDAYMIGGSKAGSYKAESLSSMDGYRYFNMFNVGGTFAEYELVTKYLLEHGSPKKIIVNVSGGEVRFENRDQEKLNFYLPAMMTGASKFREYVSFLFKSVTGSIDVIRDGGGTEDFTPGGERQLCRVMDRTFLDWESFTQKKVLADFASHMRTLFTTDEDLGLYDSALAHFRNMKEMCDDAGVEFMVILAPVFIGEASEHESTYYQDFMLRLASVTDYWDFSGYHAIDLNPYNFYNEGHFYYEVGDLVIDTIAGKRVYDGFGTLVTRENASEHVNKRRADYLDLQKEYLETGTVQLFGKEDASCIYQPPAAPHDPAMWDKLAHLEAAEAAGLLEEMSESEDEE